MKSFGKSEAFAVGLYFLSFVFFPILGFGDARYLGPVRTAGYPPGWYPPGGYGGYPPPPGWYPPPAAGTPRPPGWRPPSGTPPWVPPPR